MATKSKLGLFARLRQVLGRPSPRVMNRYDVTDGTNAAGGRIRRPAHAEKGGEESVLPPFERLKAQSLTRDLVRNSGHVRGIDKAIRVNVVGDLGKLQFREPGEWFDEAARYFNATWGRAADFCDGSTWRECLQLAVHALCFDGEFVAVHDDGILTDAEHPTNRICFFEADRIAPLSAGLFAPYAARGLRQEGGVIYDRLGRKCGVVISSKPGLSEITEGGSFIVLQRDPAAHPWECNWVHVMRKQRLRQGRGVADAVTAAATAVDSMEILGLEMQSAKISAARYATVYQADDPVDELAGLGVVDGGEEDEGEGGEENAGPQEPEFSSPALEELTGGNVDYLRTGDKVEFAPANRPNPNLAAFLDYSGDVVGAAFGLSHSYARQKADTSYTAFRGDMTMAWRTFTDLQQFVEDAFSDWAAVRVVRAAVAAGDLPAGPDGWENAVAWQYPAMPAVDEQKEQSALAQKLKNGLATYRGILGPDWRAKLDDLAEEIAYAREKGIPLSILETAAGAVIPGTGDNND